MEDEPVSFSWTIEWHSIQTAVSLILVAAVVLVIIGASILDSYLAGSASRMLLLRGQVSDCIATMEENK